MKTQLIHLRIKIRSLADEARSIRQEARKTTGMVKWGLNNHRTMVVRPHSRHNLLAYGLLRGVPYEVIEKKCQLAPNLSGIEKHARKFGGTDDIIKPWIENAKAYLKIQKEELKLAS